MTITREEIHVQSVKAKDIDGYAWVRVNQFQDRTVEDFAAKVEDLYKKDPKIKGFVLDLRNDPGGLLEGAVGIASAFLPADSVVVKTNGQINESKQTFKATPDDYLRRGGSDPLKRLPAVAQDGAAGGADQRRLGLGQRDRRRRAAGLPPRHADGRAVVRQGLRADGDAAAGRHRRQDHHRALLHAQRPLDPGQGHRARGVARRDRRRQRLLRAAHAARPTSTSTWSTARRRRTPSARRNATKQRTKLEAELAKNNNKPLKPLPEFGSPEDFQLNQALNRLRGQPVMVSKTATERKAEDTSTQ